MTNIADIEKIFNSMEITDLSRPLEQGMPAWPTQARYGSIIYDSYEYGGDALHSQITFSEHTGTHVDAPVHFIPEGLTIDEMPLESLMGRGVKIDVSGIMKNSLEPEIIRDFEKREGCIKEGDIVLFRFGWDKKYALQPDSGDYLKDWPGLSAEAAELLAERKIKAAGCDTLSLDPYKNKGHPAHHILLGKGIAIIENICNLDRIPVFSYIIGMPLKFKRGSGSPLRLAALTEKS